MFLYNMIYDINNETVPLMMVMVSGPVCPCSGGSYQAVRTTTSSSGTLSSSQMKSTQQHGECTAWQC